jgi:hypothetical protein
LTKEEAKAALAAKAFVKFGPTDGRIHWGQGQIIEVSGDTATVRQGARHTRVSVDDLVLHKAANQQNGVTLPRCKSGDPKERGEYVIFDSHQWVGYAGAGNGWTDDDDRWHKYQTSAEAVRERDRLNGNGIKGLNVLTHSAAFERLYQHHDSTAGRDGKIATEELSAKTTADSLTKVFAGGLSNGTARALTDTMKDILSIAERDAALERDIFNDRDNNAKLEREIAERQRLVEVGERRVKEKAERREQLNAERAGLLAKMAAMMPR